METEEKKQQLKLESWSKCFKHLFPHTASSNLFFEPPFPLKCSCNLELSSFKVNESLETCLAKQFPQSTISSTTITRNRSMLGMKIIVAAFLAFIQLVHSHTVLLPSYGRRCFYEKLTKGDELSVSFQFGDRSPTSTQQQSGDFILYGASHNEVLKNMYDVEHGEATITAPYTGRYQYCFLNERSSIDTKDVTFNVYGVVYMDVDDPNNDSLDASVRKLSKLVKEVKNEQDYIVIRERTHRNTAESTNDRVKWWSIFQLIVVVANSLFQIYYLKRFFEVTSYV